MSANYVTLSATVNSDAAHRTFCALFHNALIAAGWLQTADTGQANLATLIQPGQDAVSGFEVWAMNDALAATFPALLKIEYSAGFAAGAGFYITVGFATDGAGTIVGNSSTRIQMKGVPGGTGNCYFSGTSGSFRFVLWPSLDRCLGLVSIERDRDALGVPTSHGLHIIACARESAYNVSRYVPLAGTAPAPENKLCALLSTQVSQAGDGFIGVSAVRPVNGVIRPASLGVLACCKGDFIHGSVHTVAALGGSHTYVAITHDNAFTYPIMTGNNNAALLMLFE